MNWVGLFLGLCCHYIKKFQRKLHSSRLIFVFFFHQVKFLNFVLAHNGLDTDRRWPICQLPADLHAHRIRCCRNGRTCEQKIRENFIQICINLNDLLTDKNLFFKNKIGGRIQKFEMGRCGRDRTDIRRKIIEDFQLSWFHESNASRGSLHLTLWFERRKIYRSDSSRPDTPRRGKREEYLNKIRRKGKYKKVTAATDRRFIDLFPERKCLPKTRQLRVTSVINKIISSL